MPNLDPKDLLPISLEITKGAVTIGNSSTPNLLVAEFQRAEGSYGIVEARSKHDLYKQVLNIKLQRPSVAYVANESYTRAMADVGLRAHERIHHADGAPPLPSEPASTPDEPADVGADVPEPDDTAEPGLGVELKKRQSSSWVASEGTFPAHITHSERLAGGLGWKGRRPGGCSGCARAGAEELDCTSGLTGSEAVVRGGTSRCAGGGSWSGCSGGIDCGGGRAVGGGEPGNC